MAAFYGLSSHRNQWHPARCQLLYTRTYAFCAWCGKVKK